MRKNRKGGFVPKKPQQSGGKVHIPSEKEELICDATAVFQAVQEQASGPAGHILGAFIEQIGDTSETIGKARKILGDEALLADFIKLQKINYKNDVTTNARELENKRLENIEKSVKLKTAVILSATSAAVFGTLFCIAGPFATAWLQPTADELFKRQNATPSAPAPQCNVTINAQTYNVSFPKAEPARPSARQQHGVKNHPKHRLHR
jgi:hypothetical protein